MSHEKKLRVIGAKKACSPITIDSLMNFAEKVIRTDKEAALRAQNSSSDLLTPSNDRPMTDKKSPRISALSDFNHRPGSVKIKSNDGSDESAEKLIPFGRKTE